MTRDKSTVAELRELSRESPEARASGRDDSTREWGGWRERFGRSFVCVCFVGVCGLGYWASRSELEQVVRGSGRVIPSSSTQIIQSLEGGIVSELSVKQGDHVKKGDLLLRLHDKQFASRYQENLAQRDVLQARVVRLRAEAEGAEELKFPDDLATRRPDMVKKEQLLFEKRRLDEKTHANYTRQKLVQVEKKLAFLAPAINAGSISQLDKMEMEGEMVGLKGQLETMMTAFARDAMEHYDLEVSKLDALLESIKADEDRLDRVIIRSPVTGTVNAIFAETEGRVVKSGDPIMEVVPEGESVMVEAEIRPSDIAFLNPGQPAHVRFTAYDFATYGGLDGTVDTIGVDTIAGPRGERVYTIRGKTKSDSLGQDSRSNEPLLLKPGMVAEVDILTGRRTILEYMLRPIERARQRALRER